MCTQYEHKVLPFYTSEADLRVLGQQGWWISGVTSNRIFISRAIQTQWKAESEPQPEPIDSDALASIVIQGTATVTQKAQP